MFKLQTGMIVSLIITGIVLLYGFFTSLPDGKLHIVFCNVGQGDATYIRFPYGRDMLVDGGPNDSVIRCLGRYMPFWDRKLDIVALTHAQKDHMEGLKSVVKRYGIGSFVSPGEMPDIGQHAGKSIRLSAGMKSTVGSAGLSVLWPPKHRMVLGASTDAANDTSLVLKLSYGSFDVILPGDADSASETEMERYLPADTDGLEVFKVPHHGSETAVTDRFLRKLFSGVQPIALISVGKNTYGHPGPKLLERLEKAGYRVLRTDQKGSIEIVSDGKTWEIRTER